MLRARNAETLPVASNDAEDFDNLNDLLQHIGHTSPELLVEVSKPLNAIPSRRFLEDSIEQSCITGVLAQKQQTSDCSASAQRLITENQVILEEEDDTSLGSENSLQTDSQTSVSHSFQQARKLFSQLGFTSWEKRPDIHLLKKGDQLLRELKHLDAKKCRETHKIAVIYVAEGQEDKQSILSNSSGTECILYPYLSIKNATLLCTISLYITVKRTNGLYLLLRKSSLRGVRVGTGLGG